MQAVVWMLGQCTCFAIMALSARALSTSMSAYEMIFFRAVFGFLFMLPWMKSGLRHEMRQAFGTGRTGFLVVRNVLAFAAMTLWFIGIGLMPISDAVAIQFTLPLFVALGAAVFLGETVGARRWIAVGIGFLGALVILRPGIIEIGFGTLAVTGSAIVYAVVHLMTKSLSGAVPGTVIVFFMNVAMLPLGLAFALPVWVWPVWADLPWLFALGSVRSISCVCRLPPCWAGYFSAKPRMSGPGSARSSSSPRSAGARRLRRGRRHEPDRRAWPRARALPCHISVPLLTFRHHPPPPANATQGAHYGEQFRPFRRHGNDAGLYHR
jgi:drug/metabolite transporter (DMT)-like permease